jgi:hypothetical protein
VPVMGRLCPRTPSPGAFRLSWMASGRTALVDVSGLWPFRPGGVAGLGAPRDQPPWQPAAPPAGLIRSQPALKPRVAALPDDMRGASVQEIMLCEGKVMGEIMETLFCVPRALTHARGARGTRPLESPQRPAYSSPRAAQSPASASVTRNRTQRQGRDQHGARQNGRGHVWGSRRKCRTIPEQMGCIRTPGTAPSAPSPRSSHPEGRRPHSSAVISFQGTHF